MDEPCCQPVDTVVGHFAEEETPSPSKLEGLLHIGSRSYLKGA